MCLTSLNRCSLAKELVFVVNRVVLAMVVGSATVAKRNKIEFMFTKDKHANIRRNFKTNESS